MVFRVSAPGLPLAERESQRQAVASLAQLQQRVVQPVRRLLAAAQEQRREELLLESAQLELAPGLRESRFLLNLFCPES